MTMLAGEAALRASQVTISGARVCPFADPRTLVLRTRDIARGLAMIVRYGGQVPDHLSVAEHCVRCVRAARREDAPPGLLRALLLHDAHEAYLWDWLAPYKRLPEFDALRPVADRIQAEIEARYGVPELYRHGGLRHWAVRKYDRASLEAELDVLRPGSAGRGPGGTRPWIDDGLRPRFWGWRRAEREFLREFRGLFPGHWRPRTAWWLPGRDYPDPPAVGEE